MKILVTGHMGFVGEHLVARLEKDGHEVVGIDLKAGEDIFDCNFPDDVERVYHLAAQTDAQFMDPITDASQNILCTLMILERYKNKVVLASSSMVNYPKFPYAISKAAAENYAMIYGAAIVRFCNLHGPGGHSVIDKFEAADNEIVIYGDGEQVRTYAPVSAAIDALIEIKPGEFTVLGGEDLSVNEIASRFAPQKQILKGAKHKYDITDGRQIYPNGEEWIKKAQEKNDE